MVNLGSADWPEKRVHTRTTFQYECPQSIYYYLLESNNKLCPYLIDSDTAVF